MFMGPGVALPRLRQRRGNAAGAVLIGDMNPVLATWQ